MQYTQLNCDPLNMISVSFVNTKDAIRSKWQANFLQIFPIEYNASPKEHYTDKHMFDRYYCGKKDYTFEEFKAL